MFLVVIVDLSISPFSQAIFSYMYFEGMELGASGFRIVFLLVDLAIFKRFYSFIYFREGKGRRTRGRETLMCGMCGRNIHLLPLTCS